MFLMLLLVDPQEASTSPSSRQASAFSACCSAPTPGPTGWPSWCCRRDPLHPPPSTLRPPPRPTLAPLHRPPQATLAFLPVTRPFSETANRLSTHICLTAHRFFPLSVELEDAAAFAVPNTTFVIGLEPHSVLPISVICFHPAAPLPVELLALKRCALASSAVFRVPGVRHLWQWLGLQSVDRKNAARLLAAGHSIILVPGGVQECLFMEADYETVFLKRRYGFVKLALQTGSPLVPAFSFGQSRTFKFYRPRVGALDALSRMLGCAARRRICGGSAHPSNPLALTPPPLCRFAPMVFWGQWGSPLPFAQRVHTVIGTPIPVAKTPAPTDQQVGELLERFIAEMTGLFERHKAKAGFPDLKLRVM